MRQTLPLLILSLSLLVPGVARAEDAQSFEAVPELPQARVMCVGDAEQPQMLRFAFQAEPEGRDRPEMIRTSSGRQQARAPRQAAPRQAQRAPAGPPVLWLPCIRG